MAAFSAYRNLETEVAGGATIVWNSERFDVSSSYDTSTGVFTCPQDGYYFFSVTVYSGPVSRIQGRPVGGLGTLGNPYFYRSKFSQILETF